MSRADIGRMKIAVSIVHKNQRARGVQVRVRKIMLLA